MLHDVAYQLLYRAPHAALRFRVAPPERERERACAACWAGLPAALERHWLSFFQAPPPAPPSRRQERPPALSPKRLQSAAKKAAGPSGQPAEKLVG